MNAIFYRYGSVYEPDMLAAFRQAGLNVVEISREIDDKSVTDRERIDFVMQQNPFVVKYDNIPRETRDWSLCKTVLSNKEAQAQLLRGWGRSYR